MAKQVEAAVTRLLGVRRALQGGCSITMLRRRARPPPMCAANAAARMRRSENSSWSSSSQMRPPDITRMRWQTFISSGNSDDTRMIAAPAPASSWINRYTSALAAMSMPRVGSSKMRMSAPVRTHLPITSFC